ncbi:MAG: MBL fold metallo-hydrolase [Phormidesmis sp. FL-bin-119]|nr:MBL fold metallo-hydrolase [Pedobacter sp.]
MNISANTLRNSLEKHEDILILDVRPLDQREEWYIPGSIHADIYKRLNEGDLTALNDVQVPKNKKVVTVCAAGRVSQIASNALRQRGIEAYSLEGGMKAWNYAWNVAEIKGADVTIIQVRRVAKGCISYVVGSGKEAFVVDASLNPEVYSDIAGKNNWTIIYVMDTHIHADYISRTSELAKATGEVHLFTENADVEYDFTPLSDKDLIPFGSANLTAVFTPGHTQESVSYLINESYLLTGDTLFTNGVGRPDLKADHEQGLQKAEQLFDSLGRILNLSDKDLLILPAHTSQAVAFDEQIIGDKLSSLSARIELLRMEKEEFVEQTMRRIPPTPPNYLQITSLNKTGSYKGINPADLEAGANRCAIS